mgnify:CR=1 FL=1|jgi:Aspartate/tyrosine/aromatic aminotransferase
MNVTLSATLAANEEITRRRTAGERVLHMAFGEAGLPVHPSLRERLEESSAQNGYGPVAGAVELREAAAGYWTRRNVSADPDLIVCGPGSKPLLYALLMALGGDIVLPRPSWVSYAAQAELIGVRPLLLPPPPGEGGVPDPDLVAEVVRRARAQGREVRSMLVTLPDNPTGLLPAPETVHRLVEVARALDLMIISDEIYGDLVHDPLTPCPGPATLAPERTIVTTGLSKSLALGGWRIGVARLPDQAYDLRDRLLAIASEIWSSPTAPVQHAAAYAFTEPVELVARIADSRRLHGTVVRAVAERFRAAGAAVAMPQGGFYVYPDFSFLDEFRTSDEFAAALLDRYGVGVLPGSAFGDDPHALRVRVATSMMYGETTQQRLAALSAQNPLALPWIAEALDHLDQALAGITGSGAANRKLASFPA